MKVILIKDVPKVGKKYEIKDLPNGYAQNFLFPRKLAQPATPDKIKQVEREQALHKTEEKEREESLKAALASLDGAEITITTKADEQGHLFKKIKAADVAHALQENKGIDLDPSIIELEEPLAAIGTYDIALKTPSAKAVCKVTIEKE